jgi:hypothetical protein
MLLEEIDMHRPLLLTVLNKLIRDEATLYIHLWMEDDGGAGSSKIVKRNGRPGYYEDGAVDRVEYEVGNLFIYYTSPGGMTTHSWAEPGDKADDELKLKHYAKDEVWVIEN